MRIGLDPLHHRSRGRCRWHLDSRVPSRSLRNSKWKFEKEAKNLLALLGSGDVRRAI